MLNSMKFESLVGLLSSSRQLDRFDFMRFC